MLRLKCLTAACLLALAIGSANATTFNWTITGPEPFVGGQGQLTATDEGSGKYLVTSISGEIATTCSGSPCALIYTPLTGVLPVNATETFALENDNLIYYNVAPQPFRLGIDVGFNPSICGVGCGDFLIGYGPFGPDPGGIGYFLLQLNGGAHPLSSFTLTLDDTSTTPLPAALPLFAGGLGLMGLLARRRKRTIVTVRAAV